MKAKSANRYPPELRERAVRITGISSAVRILKNVADVKNVMPKSAGR
jgi:hypothetical protein|nr:hypothetical protein [Tenebrionicola larvae]